MQFKEKVIHFSFLFTGLLVIVLLFGIFLMLFLNALRAFEEVSLSQFFLNTLWNPSAYGKPSYGILSMAVSTLMVTFGAMVIAVPIGIGAACYISEIAPSKVREILKPIVEILAGIPSVVIGFLGIVLVGPAIAKVFSLGSGLNALNGCILLAIMALPTIISISEDAIRAVPNEFKEASFALGASRWETLIKVTMPSARSGVIAGVLLGVGRAIGETMTVLMATGNAPAFPEGFLDSIKTITATIAMELGEVAYGSTHYYGLFAVGTVLFVMSLCVNLATEIVSARGRRGRI
jgi:phosphate transport system permease protein